jgi:hypothetical protein
VQVVQVDGMGSKALGFLQSQDFEGLDDAFILTLFVSHVGCLGFKQAQHLTRKMSIVRAMAVNLQ